MIHEDRIKELNDSKREKGKYILYWMQASQRAANNHALEYAAERAKELDKPLVVFFGLTDSFPDANRRHYFFMLEGLKETKQELEKRDIKFVMRNCSPPEGAEEVAEDACEVVVDRGYLDVERKWRSELAEAVSVPLTQVETDIVVPVEEASGKEEYAARTIRPKIQEKMDEYLKLPSKRKLSKSSLDMSFDSLDFSSVEEVINSLDVNEDVEEVDFYHGGRSKALERLEEFIEEKMDKYPDWSNDPSKDGLSGLSPYLHFGQISPVYVAKQVKEKGGEGSEEFLEQLVVRRELAINFVYYNENYDSLECVPDWAEETLEKHKDDKREYVYTEKEFENAETHDEYWNAAQMEMVKTGKMHSYMRMYWGKKILEWTESPEEAYRIALKLNNRYELDGRDPNGYTGVAWCFGKHDQGWKERPVYGKVRYMSSGGLERKFDVEGYVEKVEEA